MSSVRLNPIRVDAPVSYQQLEDDYREGSIWKFLYGGFAILLLVGFVIALYFVFFFRTEYIDPKRCPSIRGPYAVRASINADPIETVVCPAGVCRFEVENLGQAIAQCNNNFELCQAFVYQDTSPPTMWYVNAQAEGVANSETDMYIRQ